MQWQWIPNSHFCKGVSSIHLGFAMTGGYFLYCKNKMFKSIIKYGLCTCSYEKMFP